MINSVVVSLISSVNSWYVFYVARHYHHHQVAGPLSYSDELYIEEICLNKRIVSLTFRRFMLFFILVVYSVVIEELDISLP